MRDIWARRQKTGKNDQPEWTVRGFYRASRGIAHD